MNAFSARIANSKNARHSLSCLTFLLFACVLLVSTAPAFANDRMAGGKNSKSAATAKQSRQTGGTGHKTKYFYSLTERDLFYLESLGLVKRHDKALIARDMWSGSSFEDAYELISYLPVKEAPAPIHELQKFILTMSADTSLLENSKINRRSENQTDLYTLRLEKLLEAGAFSEAADLYSKSVLPPHNERMAKTVLLALLYNGKTAQTCLDDQILNNEDLRVHKEFWKKLDDFCTVILSKKVVRNKKPDSAPKKSQGIEGHTLAALSYRFAPENIEDITARSSLEKAVLFGTGKIDYGRMSPIEAPEKLSLADLSALLSDKNLPAQHRYRLIPYGISTALMQKSDIPEFYTSIELPVDFETVKMNALDKNINALEDWQKIPFLYQLLIRITAEKSRLDILDKALLGISDEELSYLYPFATVLTEAGLENIKNESLGKAASLLFLTLENSELGKINWKNIARQTTSKTIPVSCFLEKDDAKNSEKEKKLEKNNIYKTDAYTHNQHAELCRIMFKLDKERELHNYGGNKSYEKQIGLTFDGDYVMPFKDLADRLDEAVKKNRHAEIVMLSILVFQSNAEGQDIPSELLEKTTDALSTVGLIEVSQATVRNIIAGYDEQK